MNMLSNHLSQWVPHRALLGKRIGAGVVLCVALVGAALPAGAQSPAPKPFAPRPDETYEARVTRVSDGDTLWIKPLAGGTYRKLRLDGIDAPELCQDGGAASRDALKRRLMDQAVEVTERRRDDYGRALVRLNHRGENVAAWLVREGWAWSYHWRHSDGPYAEEEAQARDDRKGVFALTEPEEPRLFRRRHGPCPMPERPAAKNQLPR